MNQTDTKKAKDVILVVDDQPNNLKVIASVLGRDYSLSIANSGANALKILENHPPDLILLDIMMPDMDGYEVCRRIRANEQICHIPIIFLTAKSDIDDVVKGFRCGAVDYITKPFNATEVEARVRNHLNLKHALDDLKIANQKLNELNETKDKFFNIIAHDLRSPFNAIMGYSRLLADQFAENELEGIDHYAAIIVQSSQLAVDLLANLLEWARAQTGKIEFTPKILDLTAIINSNIRLVEDAAGQKSITISKSVPESLEIFADEHMLSTVIRNLISNAVKFTYPRGEVKVTAECRENEILVTVKDNGVGILKERIDRLFSIGKSTSTTGTAKETGTGLGLILCKEFIEKHNGRIWAESVSGQGSVFSFSIPCDIS